MHIKFGLDVLLSEYLSLINNKKIGIVAHPASITSNFQHISHVISKTDAKICAYFGPEHGFSGAAQDMESVTENQKYINNVPLYSLYGKTVETLSPDPAVVKELDILIVDLADIGSRYYTFIWTAVLCLDICIKTDTRLLILDRPNPINGTIVEGAPQDPDFLSFVGLMPVAVRHGLTIGEIVRMAAFEKNASDLIKIIPANGWKRELFFDETALPWIPPSPNMPNINTAIIYPGGCLLEATQYSEGRGTTMPFELFGAPEVDNNKLCSYLNNQHLKGVYFRPVTFKPMFQKHMGKNCNGAAIHITDRKNFESYKTGIAVLLGLHKITPQTFRWRDDPYEFIDDIPAIDLLTGSNLVRKAIEQDAELENIWEIMKPKQKNFKDYKFQFHMY